MVRRLENCDHMRTKSVELYEIHCLRAISSLTRTDSLQNIKIKDTFSPESSQMSSDTEDAGGLGKFAIHQRENIVRQPFMQDLKGQRKKGWPLKRWSDQIRSDTGLSLLISERYEVNRAGCREVTSRRTASVNIAYVFKSVNH